LSASRTSSCATARPSRSSKAASLSVSAGEVASLVGPSGSGKSTILRAIAGLHQPAGGHIERTLERRDVGFLFQDDALLPWRTARQNVALGMRLRGIAKAKAHEEAEHWLARLGIAGFGDRYPRQLSGGQRKRVALAQVLSLEPKLLLMDEPFASLDAIVRHRVTQDLLQWVERGRHSRAARDTRSGGSPGAVRHRLPPVPRPARNDPQPLRSGPAPAARPDRRARRSVLRPLLKACGPTLSAKSTWGTGR
jgi:ABC-type nitrate/sulfonate/bicarbonate transport system ATPase subunit